MKSDWSSENEELNVVKKKLLNQKLGFLQDTSYGDRQRVLSMRQGAVIDPHTHIKLESWKGYTHSKNIDKKVCPPRDGIKQNETKKPLYIFSKVLSGKKKSLLRMCNKRPSVLRIWNSPGNPKSREQHKVVLGWQHPSHLARRKHKSYLDKGALKPGCLRIPTDKILPNSKFRITKHTSKQTTLNKSQQKQNSSI